MTNCVFIDYFSVRRLRQLSQGMYEKVTYIRMRKFMIQKRKFLFIPIKVQSITISSVVPYISKKKKKNSTSSSLNIEKISRKKKRERERERGEESVRKGRKKICKKEGEREGNRGREIVKETEKEKEEELNWLLGYLALVGQLSSSNWAC